MGIIETLAVFCFASAIFCALIMDDNSVESKS